MSQRTGIYSRLYLVTRLQNKNIAPKCWVTCLTKCISSSVYHFILYRSVREPGQKFIYIYDKPLRCMGMIHDLLLLSASGP
jgi:hypothetical protein